MSKKTPHDLYCRNTRIFYGNTPKKRYTIMDCIARYVANELVPMAAIFMLFVGIAYVIFSILAGN